MSRHESFASHTSASLISASLLFKPIRVSSSSRDSQFQDSIKKFYMLIGSLIFKIGLPFSTCKLREVAEIILKSNNVPREYKIPLREMIRGAIMDAYYVTIRDRQTRNIFN